MGASITLAGESLIAQKQGNGQILDVTQIIFGYIPGLDTTLPVDRTAGFPMADDVVHTMNITRKGYLSPNQVVYSALMGSDIGDFDFNWMGLSTAEGTLLIAAYVPTQQKRREIPPLQTGNNLTRNIVLEYDGAQGLTGINVPASTWQFDFSTEFAAIRKDIADLKVALANPANAVSLDGPVLIYANSTNVYKITDYNRFSLFSATTSVGTVAIAADTLTLTIPAGAAAGVVTLEVQRDGVKAPFKVALGNSAIGTPSITSPVNLAVGVALATTLTTSAFVAYPATADTHKDTDWRIKNAAGDVVWQSLANAANKTSITLPANALQPGVQYFPEARHNGVTLGSSAYSPATKYTTSAVSITTPSILSPINGATGVTETPTITTSAFATVPAASDTHKSTNWRLRNYLGDVIWSSMADTVNLTSIKLPAGLLSVAKNHTIDVQYNGVTLPSTPWQSSGFLTKAAFDFGKYLAIGTATAPFITVYGQDVDTFMKLPEITSLPTTNGLGVAFSADGEYLAVSTYSAPFIVIYKRSGDTFNRLANPSVLPTSRAYSCTFSSNGLYLVVAGQNAPFITIYKRSGDTYTKLPDPAFAPGNRVISVSFSSDGLYLVLGLSVTPYLNIYKVTGDEFSKLALPASVPPSPVNSVVFSADTANLYVAHDNTPFLTAYSRSGDVFTKLANPAILPGDNCKGVSVSTDGLYIALSKDYSPFLAIYKKSGSVLTRLESPASLPSGNGKSCAFSADGKHLVVGHDTSPFITIYSRSGDIFTKLANPAVLPTSAAIAVALFPRALEVRP